MTSTYLGIKGYSIYKECLPIEEQETIRKELTVKAFAPKSCIAQPVPFPVYRESAKKFYLPRFYGFDTYGDPDEIKISEGKPIDLKFKGELRPAQKPVVEKFIKHAKRKGCGLLEIHCGFGKCHKIGTPIMLSNGKIKKVENIKVGDKLMGDDSTPRTVLSLARGRETMYKVIPKKGDSYTVNESHILSLKCSSNYSKKYKKGTIHDISIKDYLALPPTFHGRGGPLLGYKVPILFPEKKVDLDPYFLGIWLGDGNARNSAITSIDKPIIDYITKYATNLNLYIRKCDSNGTRCPTYFITSGNCGGRRGCNTVLNMLKKHNLIQNKHIPHIYKCNSRKIQLELLAGIIDSDGSYRKCGYDIIQKRENLLDDIIFLARSLGFAAYKKECQKSCMYKGEKRTGTYYRTNIHGKGIEEIPVKCYRKKASPRKQIKDVLVTRIKLEKQEIDDYYGFEIDGNRRFLLGNFTVTHNTICGLKIISQLKKKTLVIVHKDFLLRQWVERIEQFLPDARVGRIQADIIDVENKDIVIGMLQSISMKEYPLSLFQEFGLAIFDECFPYYTKIHTEMGIINIGSLYEKWKNKEVLPNILSFNRETKKFEYKKMTYAWRKEKEDLIKIKMSKRTINCTPEHKILTINGYIEANKLKLGDLIISKYDKNISKKNYEIIPVLNEDYGTLKITNISYFKNKGANRCIKPYVYDIEVEDNHNFIIGSGAPKNQEQYIDGPVVSNCHHISAEVFSRSLFKIVTKYALGLSATMKRKDGLTPVFKMFLGDVVVKKERPLQDNVRVNAISYINTDAKYSKTELNYRGQTNYTIMIKKLCEFNRRSEFILKVLIKTLKNYKGDQIMIIGHNKSLLKYLHDAIVDRKISDVGYYVGGMKPKDLKESENKPVIIATYAMAEEALDIKTLAILLMATPKVDVRQAVGRILRSVDGQKLVVDIIDQHPIFQRHWKKRRTWYNKQTFKIMHTDIEGFKKDNWQLLKKRGKIKVNIPSSDPLSIFSQGKCQF